MNNELILVINPGSTSTKAALYRGGKEMDATEIIHSAEKLSTFGTINEQLDFRKNAVLEFMDSLNIKPSQLAAVACRGGVVGQLESGAYIIDEGFVEASINSKAPHPANLSPVIGYEIAKMANLEKDEGELTKAYVYDPVCGCGKPERMFTVTGIPDIEKPFLTHVLNSRAVSVEQAQRDGIKLNEAAYIVAHLGGGITVNLVKDGKIKDFVGDDEGGFSPERSGGLPVRPLVKLCYSGKYTEEEMQTLLKGRGGFMAYLGTNDLREVEKKINNGDSEARLLFDALVLQTAKDIASLAAVECGKIDKIILTGGMAYSKMFTEAVIARTRFIAPVSVIAGTYEMEALALGVLRVLRGEEKANILAG